MLQKIRSNLQGVVAYGIVGLLVVVFAMWGVDALFMGDPVADVAEVNGDAISELELNQAVYRQRQQLLARMGEQGDPARIDEAMLREPVLQQLIMQRLLLQNADANDLVISEGMANQYIRQQPEFQVDGAFSPERFDVLIRSNGMTPAVYRDRLMGELQVNQLLSGLAGSEFVTDRELEMMFAVMNQKRDIETAVLSNELGAEHAELGEGEAQAYYDEHGDEFMTEERVRVEYIELQLEQFYPEVAEEEIATAYRAAIGQPDSLIRRRAAHILLEEGAEMDDERAQQLLAQLAGRLEAGETFADLAAEYSDDIGSKGNGGDLGYTDGSAFPEPFEDALAGLAEGAVSAPVRSDAGWHLIKLLEVDRAEPPSLEERRDEIVNQLQLDKAEPLYAVKLEELKDISFNAADLASVADMLELRVETSELFGRNGLVEGVFGDQRVLTEAFSDTVLSESMNSEVVELSPGHAVVLRLVERQKPEPIPFAEVAERIEARLLADKATAYLRQRAEEIQAAVLDGQSLSDLSGDEGIEYEAHSKLTRENTAGVEQAALAAAFRLPNPADRPSVTVENLADGRVVVVVLNTVEAGSLDEFDEGKRNNLQGLLSRYRTERVVEGYRSALRQEADIEVM